MRNQTPHRRPGAAAVEFAIIAPIILLLFVQMIDIWRVSAHHQSCFAMAHAGAIMGTQDKATDADIESAALANNTCDNLPKVYVERSTINGRDFVSVLVEVKFDWFTPLPMPNKVSARRTYVVPQAP